VGGVEDAQGDQGLEVLDGESSYLPKEVWLELGDHVAKSVLTEVSQVHECRYPRGELDQFLLHLLSLRLVSLLFRHAPQLTIADIDTFCK